MELYFVMKKETIRKSIGIGASKEKVWEVLFDEKYLPIWYAEFSLGACAQGTWRVGSKILFTDISGGGLVGKVVVNRPCRVFSVEYLGLVVTGEEDYESDEARALRGGREIYRLQEQEGSVLLSVETDMPEESYNSMALAWEKALLKIRYLAEAA
ncbi:SRPBCC domain-containing protein [Salmonirosea aquatica]|uniref:SRPBCC domain-containing protein n=1 Tax=Salmonirosea aquatica TaxID=2654236 RepID=A0A7C9FRE1_9BACT|nr:SRPBCC domain-containing protein [Cytophagaceae bacterium SJW1-29]